MSWFDFLFNFDFDLNTMKSLGDQFLFALVFVLAFLTLDRMFRG